MNLHTSLQSFRVPRLLGLGLLAVVACGDPNNPDGTTGTLAGVVRDAETDAPIQGATLVVAGIQGQTGSEGRFEIDSVPEGTQQLTATMAGYVARTIEVQIQAGATAEITVELVPDLGPPGPSGVVATTDDAAPGTVRVSWDPVEGATSYVVYWGTLSPVDPVQGVRVADAPNPFIHTELSAGTTYYYVVTAISPDGESRPSAQVSATPDGPISIRFVNPVPGQFVEARFVVSVEITSVFQLTSVMAQVGEFTDDLTYIPASDEWEGFFDVGDTPSPSYQTVHYTASDAAGNIARTAVLVRLDRLPVVTLSAPGDDALATPSIRTTATCTDDAPGGCESLIISIRGIVEVQKVVATSSVDQEISLAEFDGEVVELRAIGTDALRPDTIPNATGKVRTVYVDASPHLTSVASAGSGTLIDANATDLLATDGGSFEQNATDTLRLVNRASGVSTVVYNVLGHEARLGALFPGGAIFLAGSRGSATRSVHEFRGGASNILAPGVDDFSLKAKGPFAIWTAQGVLTRRDLTNGTNVTVTNGAVARTNDVATTGEVAFWSGPPYEIHFFQGGTSTQLTNDGDGFANVDPVTDGIHVVYQRHPSPLEPPFSIRLSDPGGEITLASGLNREPEQGREYQVNDGWIAFVRPDAANSRQVWRRSPAGVETQVSAFGSSSTIDAMGPSGEIVFTSEATGAPRRYRAFVGGSPTDIGSALGRSIYIDGQLHVMIGATLLEVD